jgi:hypothetical protein
MPVVGDDLDLDLDEDEDESEGADAPKDEGVFGSGISLDELASKPGRWQELAAELLVAREERKAKRAADEAAKVAAEALEKDEFDWSNEAHIEGLRQEVLSRRAGAAASAEAGIKAAALARGFNADQADIEVANYKAMAEASAWLDEGRDPLTEHEAYRERERGLVEAGKAREVALRGRVGYAEDVAEAEAYIAAVKAKVLNEVAS